MLPLDAMPLHEIYHVDAFADRPFTGNPAAVCPLPSDTDWPATELLQAIALENNLSETAYFKPCRDTSLADFDLRWFTPKVEVKLCGHATLAAAFVLFNHLGHARDEVRFSTLSGILAVRKSGSRLTLDFPADTLTDPLEPSPEQAQELMKALGGVAALEIRHCSRGVLFFLLESETQVRALRPDFQAMARLEQSVLVTAPGLASDFVSRYFAPHKGVPEDPVTGSAHCILTPFWAQRLGKSELRAIQASPRGGTLECSLRGDRVEISGGAVLYSQGTLALPV
jgi:PhzF family phenazine biosynthesis protein